MPFLCDGRSPAVKSGRAEGCKCLPLKHFQTEHS